MLIKTTVMQLERLQSSPNMPPLIGKIKDLLKAKVKDPIIRVVYSMAFIDSNHYHIALHTK